MSVCGAAHPFSGAWISPNTSDEIPMIERIAPGGSSRPCSGSFDFGTRNQPLMNAMAMIGRLMRNTDPNQKCVSRNPLSERAQRSRHAGGRGPDRDRLGPFAGREDVHEDRQRRRHDERGADAHERAAADDLPHLRGLRRRAAAPTKNVASPNWSAPFRPKRSPSAPVENSRPANTSEYDATTHWSCDSVAPKSRESEGSATLRLELPTKTISRLRQRTTSIHQRRSYACWWSVVATSEVGGAVTAVAMPTSWQSLTDNANRRDAFPVKCSDVSEY